MAKVLGLFTLSTLSTPATLSSCHCLMFVQANTPRSLPFKEIVFVLMYKETCSLSIVFGLLDVLAGERHLSEQFITTIIHKPPFASILEICCREIQCQMTFCKYSNILRDSSPHLSIKIVLLSSLVWKFK